MAKAGIHSPAAAIATVLLLACGGGGEPTWRPAFDDAQDVGFLSSVWGSSKSDVFVVGGKSSAVIRHFDGDEWSYMDTPPGSDLLIWVFGFGPDEVYAVGLDGTFLHYDGATWSALDSGTAQDLWGVWGRSPDDLWIVGGDVVDGSVVLAHFDGESVTHVGLDEAENPLDARALFKVWGIGDTVLAVGQRGLVVRLAGDTWTRVDAGTEADEDFISLWGSSENAITVVGGRGGSQIGSWNGSSLETVSPEGLGGTSAVFVADDGVTFVGGQPGYVGTFDVDTGSVAVELQTDFEVHALWGSGDTLYAVGGVASEPYFGLAMMKSP